MSEEEDRPKEAGFTVKDRRRFADDGEVREEVEDRQVPAEPDNAQGATSGPGADRKLPDIDFSTFILSLSSSAMVHLGQAPHPDGKVLTDLDLAKQTIDILGLLKEKTAKNLTEEEQLLLDDLLYNLRLSYVSACK